MDIAPSRIARTIAAAQWPQVQFQHKLARGIYGFSCAGHGGIVAVIGVADLPEAAVEAARKCGLIEVVVVQSYGRRSRTFTSEKYTKDSLRELAARDPERHTVFEVWVGEEDCNWSTIVHACPSILTGPAKGKYLSESVDMDDVRASLESWNPDYLARVEGREFYVTERRDYSKAADERVTFQVRKLDRESVVREMKTREEAEEFAARTEEFAAIARTTV